MTIFSWLRHRTGRVGKIVVYDRYSATGRPLPDPRTVCRGRCEGMGCYPDMRGFRAGKYGPNIDDVPFLKCADCNGGKRRGRS